MVRIINRVRYDTRKATLISSDDYWDGRNWDRNGRNTYLYRGKHGSFFLHHTTRWQGELCRLEAIDDEEAENYYEELPKPELGYEETFGIKVEEA